MGKEKEVCCKDEGCEVGEGIKKLVAEINYVRLRLCCEADVALGIVKAAKHQS